MYLRDSLKDVGNNTTQGDARAANHNTYNEFQERREDYESQEDWARVRTCPGTLGASPGRPSPTWNGVASSSNRIRFVETNETKLPEETRTTCSLEQIGEMSRKRGAGAYTIRHAKFLFEEGSDRSPFQGVQQSSNRRVDPAAAAAPVYAVPAHLRQRGARLSIRVRPELPYNTTLYMWRAVEPSKRPPAGDGENGCTASTTGDRSAS